MAPSFNNFGTKQMDSGIYFILLYHPANIEFMCTCKNVRYLEGLTVQLEYFDNLMFG